MSKNNFIKYKFQLGNSGKSIIWNIHLGIVFVVSMAGMWFVSRDFIIVQRKKIYDSFDSHDSFHSLFPLNHYPAHRLLKSRNDELLDYTDIIENKDYPLDQLESLSNDNKVIYCEYQKRLIQKNYDMITIIDFIQNCSTYIYYVNYYKTNNVLGKTFFPTEYFQNYRTNKSLVSKSKGNIFVIKSLDHNGAFECNPFETLANNLGYNYYAFFPQASLDKYSLRRLNNLRKQQSLPEFSSEDDQSYLEDMEEINFLFINAHGAVQSNRHYMIHNHDITLRDIEKVLHIESNDSKFDYLIYIFGMRTVSELITDIFYSFLEKFYDKPANKNFFEPTDILSYYTSDMLYKISKFNDNKPINIILNSCSSQKALEESIYILPKGSAILANGEYRVSQITNQTIIINPDLYDSVRVEANLNKFKGEQLDMVTMTVLRAKHSIASPSFASKDLSGNIKIFSCVEQLEFFQQQAPQVKNITLSAIEKFAAIFTRGENYKYNATVQYLNDLIDNQENFKIKEQHNIYYDNIDNAFGCFLGFEEIYG